MKKDNNKGKKTLAAVGAVVAAGLTPGFIAASAAGSPIQGSNAEITAADVVAIAGTTYGFDELYAMQRGDTIVLPDIILQEDETQLDETVVVAQVSTKYGAPWLGLTPINARGIDDTVYSAVEQMPQFPGGEAALMKYLESHIKYPPEAAKNGIEGKVIVQFVVKKDGSVGDAHIVRSVDKDLDKEAIRVVKTLPNFTPGRQNGKEVDVWYTLPVPFKLK